MHQLKREPVPKWELKSGHTVMSCIFREVEWGLEEGSGEWIPVLNSSLAEGTILKITGGNGQSGGRQYQAQYSPH